jgi:NADPH-dependent ferric siderophore reductase
MTMPHLMNCPHETAHWCLDCVSNLGNENLVLREKEHASQQDMAKLQNLLFGDSGVIPAINAIGNKLDKASVADLEDAPFTLSPAQAHLWIRAQAAAFEHCLRILNSDSLKAALESVFSKRESSEPTPYAGSNA